MESLNGCSLSKRGQYTLSQFDPYIHYRETCDSNLYHPDRNPKGMISLGASINRLMEKELTERLSREDTFRFTPEEHEYYFNLHGKPRLLRAVANFMNRYFNLTEPITEENVIIQSGAASCLDSLSYALFDPGDAYITPVPTYGRIFTNFNNRSLAQPCPLDLLQEETDDDVKFTLTSQLLEDKIIQLKSEGKNVRGFVLINPQNPLGIVYSVPLIRDLLEVCAKYELHVVIDEIYALSLLDPTSQVTSVFSVPDLPDPDRTHMVWALTKDFCLPGMRVGVICTRNKALINVLKKVSVFCPSASIVQDAAASLLSDTKLFDLFFKAGVYVIPGGWMHCSEPGWFRLVFSVPTEELEIGLMRIESVLQNVHQGDTQENGDTETSKNRET